MGMILYINGNSFEKFHGTTDIPLQSRHSKAMLTHGGKSREQVGPGREKDDVHCYKLDGRRRSGSESARRQPST